MQSQVTYCDVYYYYCRRQRWRPNMAALRCTCEQGTNLWGEFWWIEGEHRWVFFDDEKTSETYAEQLTHCPGCGRSLERKALRGTSAYLLARGDRRYEPGTRQRP